MKYIIDTAVKTASKIDELEDADENLRSKIEECEQHIEKVHNDVTEEVNRIEVDLINHMEETCKEFNETRRKIMLKCSIALCAIGCIAFISLVFAILLMIGVI